MGLQILVTGATGLAGSEVVLQALQDGGIEEVVALVRGPLDFEHPRLKTILHKNFLEYPGLGDLFKKCDACLWCLGISQTQVGPEEYAVITHDYAVAAARAMLAGNPDMSFVFLSGMGADASEKSRTLFARVKGRTENSLRRLPFHRLIIARPGGIRPIRKKRNMAWYEKFLIPLYPLLEFLFPAYMISSVDLARAMLHVAKHGAEKQVLGNSDLKNVLKVGKTSGN